MQIDERENFRNYVEWVLFAEGTYADDENDRGGETFYGISAKFRKEIGWSGPVSRDQAITIYRQYFWDGWRCNQMHPVVAWCACDAYVQHQPQVASVILQEGLGVKIDGVIGPNTMAAAKSPNLLMFWRRYREARVRTYNAILLDDHTQADFISGWHNRLHKLVEGMYFSGLIQDDGAGGLKSTITSPAAKATGAGITLGGVVIALQSIGLDVDGLIEWAKATLPGGGLIAVATAWLAKHNFNRS